MLLNIITLSITFLIVTSCSFNKVFLKPTKIPEKAKSIVFKTKNDTVHILFNREKQFQPTFLKPNGDTMDLAYTVESTVFKASNNSLLHGWLLKPKTNSKNITVLHLHGNAGCILSQFTFVIPLVKQGYQVFVFDYSGFGFSTGEATRKNTLSDALSALDYLKSRDDVKNTPFMIYGQSYGGHLAAVVGQMKQENISALIIEGAFSSPKDIAAKTVPLLGRILVKELFSASKSIISFNKPLLVIHSTEDEIIPFSQGKKLYSKALSSHKMFMEIKGPHIYGLNLYGDSIIKSMNLLLK